MAVWTADWKSIKGDFIGYVDDVNGDVDHLREVVLNKYFVETGTKFVTYGKSSTNRDLKEKAVHYWIKSGNERVNFGGVPFMIIRSNFLECVYGPPRYKGKKKGDHEDYFKRSGRKTTRINCPAKINIKEIILFYEEKADIMKRKDMDRLSGRIKWSIYDGTAKFTKAYVFFFSKKDDHVPHDCAFGFGSHLDKRVRQKIRDLVSDGVRNADYIDLEVRRFVKTLFSDYMPSCKNRQFFPSKKSIKSYIHNDAMENDCIMDLLSTVSNNSSSDESEDYHTNKSNTTKRFKRFRNSDTMDANCTLDTLSTVDYNTSSDESQEGYHMSTTNTTNGNKRCRYSDLMDANCTLDTLSTVNNSTSSDESQEDYHMSTFDTTNSNNSICNESEVQKFNIATNSLKELREVARDIIDLSYQLPQTACLEEEVALLNTIKTYMRKQLIQDDVIVLENGCLPLPRLRC